MTFFGRTVLLFGIAGRFNSKLNGLMTNFAASPLADRGKSTCTYFVELNNPALALAAIGPLLLQRKIEVLSLHLQCQPNAAGRMLLHCRLERDRIRRLAALLGRLPGVAQLEWLVSKGFMP